MIESCGIACAETGGERGVAHHKWTLGRAVHAVEQIEPDRLPVVQWRRRWRWRNSPQVGGLRQADVVLAEGGKAIECIGIKILASGLLANGFQTRRQNRAIGGVFVDQGIQARGSTGNRMEGVHKAVVAGEVVVQAGNLFVDCIAQLRLLRQALKAVADFAEKGLEFIEGIMPLSGAGESDKAEFVGKLNFKYRIVVGLFRAHHEIHQPLDGADADTIRTHHRLLLRHCQQAIAGGGIERGDTTINLYRQFTVGGDIKTFRTVIRTGIAHQGVEREHGDQGKCKVSRFHAAPPLVFLLRNFLKWIPNCTNSPSVIINTEIYGRVQLGLRTTWRMEVWS